MLAIILTSSIITIQSSRPAKAESLLYTVGCVVRSLLSTECATKTPSSSDPTTPSEPAPTKPSDGSGSSGGSGSTGSGSAKKAGTEAPAPLKIDESKLKKLPEVKEFSSTNGGRGTGYTANVLPTIRGYEGEPTVLGAVNVAALQPSDQGWKIAGVLWYWWLLVVGVIVGVAFLLKFTLLKSFFTVAKP